MGMRSFIPLEKVRIDDALWMREQRLVRTVVLPYQWKMLNDQVPGAVKSHCIENFRIAAGLSHRPYEGVVFLDTDLYKWLEAVGYCLATAPDSTLEAAADSAIDLMGQAQQPDGYLNTYFTVQEPGKRFTNLMEGHELYTAGHLFEAAVAYWQATGKRAVLDIACRMADYVDSVFGEGKRRGYPGHPEVELALIRLYDATHEKRYLRLAWYFLTERGRGENLFEQERKRPGHRYIFPEMAEFGPDYFLAHQPVAQQRVATGHAVRAMYLYCAMADLAVREGDGEMAAACRALYRDTVERQMYVTGGIGSAKLGERFTTDYDLPNDSMYAETCASIGLMLFSRRMWLMTGEASAFDVWERALYNTVLSGIGQDGTHFFYVNPLSVIPAAVHANPTLSHVKPVRQQWFGIASEPTGPADTQGEGETLPRVDGVACCPPNLARTLSALGGSLYAVEGDDFFVLSPIASHFETERFSGRLEVEGDACTLQLTGPFRRVLIRIPEGYDVVAETGARQEGYLVFSHTGESAQYRFTLVPQTRLVWAHPAVAACAGKACVMCGATVYCLEEKDNGAPLSALRLDAHTDFVPVKADWLSDPMTLLQVKGYRLETAAFDGRLYSGAEPVYTPVTLTLAPYSQWGNRGEGEMTVWIPVRE